jgi:NitT/TauT family transport system substrate-binding protein
MLRQSVAGAAALALTATSALALEQVAFGTNWLPQAEHGGFYQALADGTYEACGLDVTIVPGGPQVNNRALMQQNIPVVAVMAAFQKHPQVILSHPGEADTWEELKDLTLLIGDAGFVSFYQWMIAAHGFTAEQRETYTFNPAPFIVDPRKGMQGFLSSEPYAVEREAGWAPNVFLIADAGYSTYATTVETMRSTIENRPEVVKCFVEGSILGWYNYLYGDNAAANALILEANPDMSQDKIDYAIAKMIEAGIVDSGDAIERGIGVMTEEKVRDFFDKMVAAGVIPGDIDWRASFTTEFVGQGLGLDLRPD